MNSSRNLFILGFALFNSLSVAGPSGYFNTYKASHSEAPNPFGEGELASVALSLFNNPMIVAFLCSVILDNALPGSRKERGLDVWDQVRGKSVGNDQEYAEVYMLPAGLGRLVRHFAYLDWMGSGQWPQQPDVQARSRGDLCELLCCSRRARAAQESKDGARHRTEEVGSSQDLESLDARPAEACISACMHDGTSVN